MRTLLLIAVLTLPLPSGLLASANDNTGAEASNEMASIEPAPEDTPEMAQQRENSRTVTWITLGILIGILGLGVLAKSRIDRSNQAADPDSAGDDE